MKNIKKYWSLVFIFFYVCKSVNAQNLNVGVDSTLFKKAKAYYQQIIHHSQKADFVIAEKYTDSLYVFSTKHKITYFELIALMNKGIFNKKRGELEKAIAIYSKVLKEAGKLPKNTDNQKLKIITLQNMATIYSEIGSHTRAIKIYKKALSLLESSKLENKTFIVGAVLSNIAGSYAKLQHTDTSIAYQEKVLNLAKEKNNNYLIVHSFGRLSERFREKKDYNKALGYALKAQKQNKNIKEKKHSEDWIFLRLGLAFQGLKKLDSATYYLLKAKKKSIENKKYEVETIAEENLAKVYETLGDFKKAQESQKRFNELNTKSLKEHKNAAVLAIKKEDEITLNNERRKNKTSIIFITLVGFITIVTLLIFLFQKIQVKKKAEYENKQLQADFKHIQKEYISLKESMLQLSEEKERQSSNEKYKKSSLSKKDRTEYMNTILEFMEVKKPYLNVNFNLSAMAEKTHINSHHLSEVLTLSFGQNFNNFINIYRVKKAQELLQNTNYEKYKLEVIAYEAGFNSKTSFNRTFKSITGSTPSEYRKQKTSKII